MIVSVFNNVTVTEKEIFDFIINPNNFDEEETHNEDGSVNKEGIVLCFEENVEYCIAEIHKTSEDKLDITWDDRRECVEHFKTFVFSYGK